LSGCVQDLIEQRPLRCLCLYQRVPTFPVPYRSHKYRVNPPGSGLSRDCPLLRSCYESLGLWLGEGARVEDDIEAVSVYIREQRDPAWSIPPVVSNVNEGVNGKWQTWFEVTCPVVQVRLD
jgi:hypothetical protein